MSFFKDLSQRVKQVSGNRGNESENTKSNAITAVSDSGSTTTSAAVDTILKTPLTPEEPSTSVSVSVAAGSDITVISPGKRAWVCMHCDIPFFDMQAKILECEVCCGHACAKCLCLTPTQYTATQRTDLLWICSDKCMRTMRRGIGSGAKSPEDARDVNEVIQDLTK